MKSILTQLFVSLGVIFLILIIAGIFFFITDPYGLRPLIFGSTALSVPVKSSGASDSSDTRPTPDATAASTAGEASATRGGFQLSAEQVQALISLGIDPAAVPASISREQEACFVGVLGEGRVSEIKGGAVPGAVEFLKAKACI